MSHGKGGPSHAPEFVAALKAAGFDFFAGVPCSLLKGLVSILDKDPDAHYVSATREDSAIGMAAGAHLGGKLPMVLMQNSGLGVSVNALASLTTMYALPVLLVISWRGEGGNDAPEHIMMGEIMAPMLDLMKIPHRVLRVGSDDGASGRHSAPSAPSPSKEPMAQQIAWAKEQMLQNKYPAALIVPGGVLE